MSVYFFQTIEKKMPKMKKEVHYMYIYRVEAEGLKGLVFVKDSVLYGLRIRQRARSASRAPKVRGTSALARVRFKPSLCLSGHFQPPHWSPTFPSQAPPTSFTACRQFDFKKTTCS